jgi:hypothetical protein
MGHPQHCREHKFASILLRQQLSQIRQLIGCLFFQLINQRPEAHWSANQLKMELNSPQKSSASILAI